MFKCFAADSALAAKARFASLGGLPHSRQAYPWRPFRETHSANLRQILDSTPVKAYLFSESQNPSICGVNQ